MQLFSNLKCNTEFKTLRNRNELHLQLNNNNKQQTVAKG